MSCAVRSPGATAEAFLRDVRHASGQNYMAGDRKSLVSLECSAGDVAAAPLFGGDRIWHTNHPLANSDRVEAGVDLSGTPESRGRLATLARRLDGAAAAALNLDLARAALSARDDPTAPVSIESGPGDPLTASMTIGAVIYELAATVRLHVTAGPPSRESWRTFSF